MKGGFIHSCISTRSVGTHSSCNHSGTHLFSKGKSGWSLCDAICPPDIYAPCRRKAPCSKRSACGSSWTRVLGVLQVD